MGMQRLVQSSEELRRQLQGASQAVDDLVTIGQRVTRSGSPSQHRTTRLAISALARLLQDQRPDGGVNGRLRGGF